MKIIGVFFEEAEPMAYPLNKEKYFKHFLQLQAAIEECGAIFRILRHQSSYLGNGKFSQSWELQNAGVVETGELKVDVVFDKGLFISDGTIPVINCEEINEICTNKYKTFELFSKYSPQTYLANNEAEFHQGLESIPGKYKVVKPLDGLEGRNISIEESDLLKKKTFTYPVLIQEFLDSSQGIPGIVDTFHDFRVALINEEIVHCIVRIPPAGELIASTSLGATMEVVDDMKMIPEAIFTMVADIDGIMALYGNRFYSIDLAMVNGQPKIIELNSRPSIWDSNQHQVFATTKKKLAKLLTSLT